MIKKARFILKLLVFALLFLSILRLTHAQTTQASQSEQLKVLQQELAQRQRKLRSSKASAQELKSVLQRSELAIAAVAKSLNNTRNELSHNKQERANLTAQAQELQQRIEQQQEQLSALVKSAYMAGNYDYAKMLMNQQDALKFERVLTYYRYFNSARQQAIAQFKADVKALQAIQVRLEKAAETLNQLLSNQQSQSAELKARQLDRQATLAQLNQTITSQAEVIAALEQNEKALIEAIEKAEKERQQRRANDLSLNGLSKEKGRLIAPAKGRVQRLYGKRRQGQVRWKGVVIEGNEGGAVVAIHQGRVLYADWLKGFGLVIIVDHGEGYMSVYGHNQALLKQAGELVRAGETMALIGQSGGQAYPNLYFEVRHKGKPLNPTDWVDF